MKRAICNLQKTLFIAPFVLIFYSKKCLYWRVCDVIYMEVVEVRFGQHIIIASQ